MYFEDRTILYADGQWIAAHDAHASVYSQTLHYGMGVFEGIRSYAVDGEACMFRAEDHFRRLLFSAKSIGLKIGMTAEEMISVTYELLEKNDIIEAYIRPFVYTSPMMSLSFPEETHLVICAWPWKKLLGDKQANICVSSFTRPHPSSLKIEAKAGGHYINSILAATEARSKGYDDALQLDVNGYVAECSGANFFYEKDGVLYTAPRGHILPGITRDTIIQLCNRMGMPLQEMKFIPADVYESDGAFVVGTAAEVTGINSVNDYLFRKPWTSTLGYKLQKEYESCIRRDDHWQPMVYEPAVNIGAMKGI